MRRPGKRDRVPVQQAAFVLTLAAGGAEWAYAPAVGGRRVQLRGNRGAASPGRQRQCEG